jgi:leucyl aminopeptidase
MTETLRIDFLPEDAGALATATGRVAILVSPDGPAGAIQRQADRLTRGAVARALAGKGWEKTRPGEALVLAYPAGLAADALVLVKYPRRPTLAEARKAGATLARDLGEGGLSVLAGRAARIADLAFGLALRSYRFDAHRTGDKSSRGGARILCADPEGAAAASGPLMALAEGVTMTRDLVSEPANVLTTTDFAGRLAALGELGVEVTILDDDRMRALGMNLLLAVGQGSASPSRLVVMEWKGAEGPPLALVGKGVVFDTGGISIKPAAGMEEMTMDMGGAAVVAGVMRTLALRKAPAHVVGLVGLVENMPSGTATRPGDIVRSMKGDTVEIINTDAEGRLVLADVLWYAQEHHQPRAIIDLATLTGAIIVALGVENAGLFSNDDTLAGQVLAAANAEGEGAWRMPMGEGYDALLKSQLADMKNIGGRDGGAISAAQFLRRFVKEGTPWVHLDIAGVTLGKSDDGLAPKGATGWGVRTLNRLIADHYETR